MGRTVSGKLSTPVLRKWTRFFILVLGPRKQLLGPFHLLKSCPLTYLKPGSLSPSTRWSGNPKGKWFPPGLSRCVRLIFQRHPLRVLILCVSSSSRETHPAFAMSSVKPVEVADGLRRRRCVFSTPLGAMKPIMSYRRHHLSRREVRLRWSRVCATQL